MCDFIGKEQVEACEIKDLNSLIYGYNTDLIKKNEVEYSQIRHCMPSNL
jgi:hypothetical protein